MRFSPALAALAVLTLAACADRAPTSPSGPPPFIPSPTDPSTPMKIDCVARVSDGSVSCADPSAGGARYAIIGGQGQYLNITATGVGYSSGTGIFQGNFTVQNLLPYPIGTRNGVSADSGGVKVFIYQGPTTTGGSGDVTVANPDGLGTLTAANQPFFKYPQMIRTDSVSAAKNWQFQLDPGVTTFTFSLLVQAETQSSAFRLVTPQAGDTVLADSLDVWVVAKAPPEVNYIRAMVIGNDTMLLSYADSGNWRGRLRLFGSAGPRTLRVVARSAADSIIQNIPFVFGNGPSLTLNEPLDSTLVSQLRFRGTCTDNTSCTVVGWIFPSDTLFSVTGPSFDVTVPLPPGVDASTRAVVVRGTDTNGNVAQISRNIHFDSSPHLEQVATGRQFLAVNAERYFYRDSTVAAGLQLRLREWGGVDSTDVVVITNPTGGRVIEAFLPDEGVAFVTGGPSGPRTLYTYHGTLTNRGAYATSTLSVAGRWAVWSNTSGADVRLDVIADSITSLINSGGVAANGDVALLATPGVRRFRAGVYTTIDSASGSGSYGRVNTDGNMVIWRRGSQIWLYDGTAVSALSGIGNDAHFLNNGWAAYLSFAIDATTQVFSRSPIGTVVRVSNGPTVAVRAVGPNGEVIYAQGGRMYRSLPPYSAPLDVGRDWNRPVFFDGNRAFMIVGRTAVEIVP